MKAGKRKLRAYTRTGRLRKNVAKKIHGAGLASVAFAGAKAAVPMLAKAATATVKALGPTVLQMSGEKLTNFLSNKLDDLLEIE